MRKFVAVVGLLALGATGAQAQKSWQSEVGLQGGFTRSKPAGTAANDYADLFDVPGFGSTTLYAIVPWRDKIAVEPSFSASQWAFGVGISQANIGLRGDYALTPKIYAAAGGVLLYEEAVGDHETQLGVQVGVGYRLRLGAGFNGRVEANWQSFHKSKLLPPSNNYSLLFGLSSPTHHTAAPRRAGRGAASAWEPMLGVQGGYARVHLVGGGDIAAFAFPGVGGATITASAGLPIIGGAFLPMQPTLYAIFPVGNKLAIEPGVDLHRVQSQGVTIFSGNLSGRLDYAVSGGWYGALGGNLIFLKATKGFFPDPTKGSASATGANLAWGYRFHFANGMGGRVEANYLMVKNSKDLNQATNTMGVAFGVSVPLR